MIKQPKRRKNTKLYYYYDREADVFYLSQGKPSSRDKSTEAENDVILRLSPKDGKIIGFTILNFTKRLTKKDIQPIELPIQAELTPLK